MQVYPCIYLQIPSIVDIVKVSQNAALLRNEQILKGMIWYTHTDTV